MSFMEPEILRTRYYVVSANHGETHFLPVDIEPNAQTNAELQNYVEGKVDDPDDAPEVKDGILARLSAPGYMDCTGWTPYDTIDEAREGLREMYGDDDDEEAADEDVAQDR